MTVRKLNVGYKKYDDILHYTHFLSHTYYIIKNPIYEQIFRHTDIENNFYQYYPQSSELYSAIIIY